MTDAWSVVSAVLAGVAAVAAALAWRRAAQGVDLAPLVLRLERMEAGLPAIERTLREEQRAGREELAATLDRLAQRQDERLQVLGQQQGEEGRAARAELSAAQQRLADTLVGRLDAFDARLAAASERLDASQRQLAQQLVDAAQRDRESAAQTLQRFGADLQQRFSGLAEGNDKGLLALRDTLERKLADLQQGNEAKLEQMRATVDEKLQSTLNARLDASFKIVSERLEQVHAGLGEMRTLATGVGDLKRVLGNVKTRGVFGEVQLAAILDELLTPEQYATNVATRPGSSERVEFAVKLPGDDDGPVWLPIDAKFPREDYERLVDAQDRADAEAAGVAAQALERRIRDEAKKIAEKYIAPPNSTDFAVLFLPTEGLYAELIRRPGLFEALQRDYRVTLTGPTTLAALLNSLRMGFRTLAIQKRSSEVWKTLGAVRTEFGKFASVVEKAQEHLGRATNTLGGIGTRTRAIERKLRDVEALDADAAQQLLGDLSAGGDVDESGAE